MADKLQYMAIHTIWIGTNKEDKYPVCSHEQNIVFVYCSANDAFLFQVEIKFCSVLTLELFAFQVRTKTNL